MTKLSVILKDSNYAINLFSQQDIEDFEQAAKWIAEELEKLKLYL